MRPAALVLTYHAIARGPAPLFVDPALLAAHLNCLFGCFWLCAVAFTLPLTRFGEVGAKRLVLLTAIPAYANWLITVVKAFRRVMLVLGVAGVIGGLARIRGRTVPPRSQGGWRELEGPDFR